MCNSKLEVKFETAGSKLEVKFETAGTTTLNPQVVLSRPQLIAMERVHDK